MSGTLAYKGPGEPRDAEEALALVEAAARHTGHLVVDTETVSLNDRAMIGLGICSDRHRAYLTVESALMRRALAMLSDVDEWGYVRKVYHNAMFDLDVLDGACDYFDARLVDDKHIADTSIMMQVQGLTSNLSLGVAQVLAMDIQEISDILPKRKNMLDVEMEVTAAKNLDDLLATERLYLQLGGESWMCDEEHMWEAAVDLEFGWNPDFPTHNVVTRRVKDCYRVDLKLIPVLRKMSRKGIKLRPERVREWHTNLSRQILELEDICKDEGFNPGSNQQVGMTLAERGNVLPFTKGRKRRQLRVDEEVLEALDDPIAAIVLKHRGLTKLRSTYFTPWLNAVRARGKFRIDLSTGRLGMFDRNLQNVPPEARDIYAPDSGLWSWADASQIELRVFAYLSQDQKMLRAYRDGEDIHWITQQALWPGTARDDERRRLVSKTFNFSVIFDANDRTLAKHTKLPVVECARYKRQWLDTYPQGAAYMESQMSLEVPWVETDFGRRCRLPDPMIFPQAHIDKCKVNYPVQGTAADIIKRCMLVGELMGLDMRLQVHDEVLVDGPMEVPKAWERVHPEVWTPFKLSQGETWA